MGKKILLFILVPLLLFAVFLSTSGVKIVPFDTLYSLYSDIVRALDSWQLILPNIKNFSIEFVEHITNVPIVNALIGIPVGTLNSLIVVVNFLINVLNGVISIIQFVLSAFYVLSNYVYKLLANQDNLSNLVIFNNLLFK